MARTNWKDCAYLPRDNPVWTERKRKIQRRGRVIKITGTGGEKQDSNHPVRQVPSVVPVHVISSQAGRLGRWSADGGCASCLCRWFPPPPPPASRGPSPPGSPLECLHFHPDHVQYPYPNANPSTSQNPNPRSLFTVYVYLDVHTRIHTHVHRACSGNTSDRQTLASPFPFLPPPSQPLTGLALASSSPGHATPYHIDDTRHIPLLYFQPRRNELENEQEQDQDQVKTKTTGNRTTATFATTIRTSLGDCDDITPQTMSFPVRLSQLLPLSLHALATAAH